QLELARQVLVRGPVLEVAGHVVRRLEPQPAVELVLAVELVTHGVVIDEGVTEFGGGDIVTVEGAEGSGHTGPPARFGLVRLGRPARQSEQTQHCHSLHFASLLKVWMPGSRHPLVRSRYGATENPKALPSPRRLVMVLADACPGPAI